MSDKTQCFITFRQANGYERTFEATAPPIDDIDTIKRVVFDEAHWDRQDSASGPRGDTATTAATTAPTPAVSVTKPASDTTQAPAAGIPRSNGMSPTPAAPLSAADARTRGPGVWEEAMRAHVLAVAGPYAQGWQMWDDACRARDAATAAANAPASKPASNTAGAPEPLVHTCTLKDCPSCARYAKPTAVPAAATPEATPMPPAHMAIYCAPCIARLAAMPGTRPAQMAAYTPCAEASCWHAQCASKSKAPAAEAAKAATPTPAPRLEKAPYCARCLAQITAGSSGWIPAESMYAPCAEASCRSVHCISKRQAQAAPTAPAATPTAPAGEGVKLAGGGVCTVKNCALCANSARRRSDDEAATAAAHVSQPVAAAGDNDSDDDDLPALVDAVPVKAVSTEIKDGIVTHRYVRYGSEWIPEDTPVPHPNMGTRVVHANDVMRFVIPGKAGTDKNATPALKPTGSQSRAFASVDPAQDAVVLNSVFIDTIKTPPPPPPAQDAVAIPTAAQLYARSQAAMARHVARIQKEIQKKIDRAIEERADTRCTFSLSEIHGVRPTLVERALDAFKAKGCRVKDTYETSGYTEWTLSWWAQ